METPTRVHEIVPYIDQLILKQTETIAKLEARIAILESKNTTPASTHTNKVSSKK